MRNYRRSTVLVVFVALGIGLAIGVALSIAPERPSPAVCRQNVSDQIPEDSVTASARFRTDAIPETPSDGTISRPRDVQVLPPPTDDRLKSMARSTSSTFADNAGPTHLRPFPVVATDHDIAPTEASSVGPVLKKWFGDRKQSRTVERIPTPTALSLSTVHQPQPKNPQTNTISRTHGEGGDRFEINISDEDIRKVLDLLGKEGHLNILASPNVKGKVSATLSDVGLDSALDAILKSTGFVANRDGQYLFVGTPADFVQMARTTDKINTRVYYPDYVTAAELQNLITPILTEGVGLISVTTQSKSGIQADMTDAGGDSYAGTDALLVRDYEAVLQEIDQYVADIDRCPLQVHIEAMILSVKLDDNSEFGVNFQLLRQFKDLRLGWGTVPDTLSGFEFDGGLKLGFLDGTLGSFLNAMETIGDTNVIATPRLMVLNKHAAEIQIGQEKGYLDTTTQTAEAATQSVAFLKVGTILRIRPFVSNDGMIRMEVHPEISDGEIKEIGETALPQKQLTQVTTNIMVRDGCTAVIGGLIQDKQQVNRNQIPLLGSLPVVGVAFRDKTEKTDRHELIVLITPNVVRERQAYCEAAKGACEFQRRQSAYAEKLSPIGKRSLGRKYVRRAKAVWLEGNRQKALRLAELAVHFDPLNREAIELRSDIWLGKPYGTSCSTDQDEIRSNAALDGPQLAPWVLQELGVPKYSADSPKVNPQPQSPGKVTLLSAPPTKPTSTSEAPVVGSLIQGGPSTIFPSTSTGSSSPAMQDIRVTHPPQ
ncbi:MAG: hypothetical protein JW888_17650 [Pirellulales bacterium]|nr:hypothetical protein [Pirellulales bacterium]